MNKKNIYIILIITLVILGIGFFYYFYLQPSQTIIEIKKEEKQKEKIMPDSELTIFDAITPTFKDIDEADVPKTAISAKVAYGMASELALKKNSKAEPTFMKTLRGLDSEGNAPIWQIGFSFDKDSGYEVIVEGDKIFSESEGMTNLQGKSLPEGWRDSGELIAEFKNNPAYTSNTVKSINYFYEPNFEKWYWTVTTEENSGVTGSL